MSADAILTPEQIRKELEANLPNWSLRDGAIHREFETAGWKATLMAVNAIGHLAEIAWHHPDLSVSFARVGIALSTHDAGGITGKDIALAKKIDEFLGWRPADEDSPLEGIPDDERFAYLRLKK